MIPNLGRYSGHGVEQEGSRRSYRSRALSQPSVSDLFRALFGSPLSFGFGAGVSLVSRGGCWRSSGSAGATWSSEGRTGCSLGSVVLEGAEIFLGMVSSSSFTDKNWLATRKVPSPGSAAWFGIDLTKLNRRAS